MSADSVASGVPSISALRGPPPPPGSYPPEFGDSPLARARAARPQRDPDRVPDDGPLLHPLAARGAMLIALCIFGGLNWMEMVDSDMRFRAWQATGAAVLVGVLLVAAGRLRLHVLARWAIAAVVAAGGLGLALLAGGVADEWLKPSAWGSIASAVGRGIDGLPGARIPYRGVDPDLQMVIPLGGTVLAVLAGVLAFWPRRAGRTGLRPAALVVLVTLYAVPSVALFGSHEFLRGALLAVLVVAFLRLERLRRRDAPAAVAIAAVAAGLSLAAAPALDTDSPWWDYETWSQSAAGARSTTFSWDHDYGPLDWPRDGRELLRIQSPQRAYWKVDNLDEFDGSRWRRDPTFRGRESNAFLTEGVDLSRIKGWSFRMRVTVRNFRSQTLPVAGSADNIVWPNQPVFQIRPGIFVTSRSVHRGDAYSADVYVPQPSANDLSLAGTSYATYDLERFTGLFVFGRDTPDQRFVFSEAFGAVPSRIVADGSSRPAGDILRRSSMRRAYQLSRTLLEDARTPYAYVRAIERYLQDGFSYTETPPDASRTLDGFLFETKQGYCQHYAGAMALLLRLGGVPARVATGFSPGSYDRKSKQYVVRDLDAHSWVEAWYPGIGWVVIDPTPAAAPPRSQAAFNLTGAGTGDVRDLGTQYADPRLAPATVEGGGPPWGAIAGGLAALLALAALARRLRTVRRSGPRPATLELERALRIAGGGLDPATTLSRLESRFAGTPPAAGYVRALRALRYAPDGSGPTPKERRGLRRALSRGRGPAGRVRALWALPPRPPRRGRRSYTGA